MTVIVNDKPVELDDKADLRVLLETIGAEPGKVAVMIDGHIVPRSEHTRTPLRDGSRIDVLVFAGGG